MNNNNFILSIFISLLLSLNLNPAMQAQSMSKKYKTIRVERTIPFSAEKVWEVVAEDYGRIAETHPLIVSSEYEAGSLKGELGAQRMCAFNDKGTQVLHEKIIEWDQENMSFVNRVLEAKKFPIDEDNSRGIYTVTPLDANSSKLAMQFEFRSKPAFMAGMMKGRFSKILNDYLLSVEHHLKTGEAVNRENFKEIKKQYASR